MSTFKNVAVSAVVALVSGGLLVSLEPIALAQDSNANTNVGNVMRLQEEVSLAYDGLYAASLDLLVSEDAQLEEMGASFGEAGFDPGAQVFYLPAEDRREYVFATLSASGSVLIGGGNVDSGPSDVQVCEAGYSAECVALVTDNPELISALPEWVTF